jgi:simple sugar transport system permease protein
MSSNTELSQPSPAQPSKRSPLARWARRNGLQIGILFVGLIIWGIFIIGAPRTFLSPQIYQAFMSSTPFFAVIALPLTLVVIAKEIDISFPSIMAIAMTSFAFLLVWTGNVWLALAGCLVTGFLVGLLNGVIITKLGIPSLVATIGTSFFWRGLVNVLNGGRGSSLVPVKDTPLQEIMVGRSTGIPAQMIWTILIAILVWVILNRTRFGAHVYLVGDNVESAKLMGINVDLTKMLAFAIVGLAAAFAGLLSSLEVSYFWPTLGEGYLLTTLSSVFLGGTSVFGGTGTIFGTFVAAFIIGSIQAGIVANNISGFWTQLIYGLIIVISVAIQVNLSRRLK